MGVAAQQILPLESGDRLDAREFECRFDAMPWLKRAELIDGVVYVQESVPAKGHGEEHARVVGWLGAYQAATPGVNVANSATIRLDELNEPQPDALAYLEFRKGVIDDDGYVCTGPELVAEIATSSASYDAHVKKPLFQRFEVQEFLLYRVFDRRVDWYALRRGRYALLTPDTQGVISSEVFPGLWLDVPALLNDNMAKVLRTLQRGLKSPEHKAFVAKLKAARK